MAKRNRGMSDLEKKSISKELLVKDEKLLDGLVEEISGLVENSEKLSEVLKTAQENEIIQKENLSEMAKLKRRITDVENRLNKLTKIFKIDIVESSRLIAEKHETANEENEKMFVNLQNQIVDLKRMVKEVGQTKR